jgi:hypothetical protein
MHSTRHISADDLLDYKAALNKRTMSRRLIEAGHNIDISIQNSTEVAYLKRISELELTVIALRTELNVLANKSNKKIDDDIELGAYPLSN